MTVCPWTSGSSPNSLRPHCGRSGVRTVESFLEAQARARSAVILNSLDFLY